MEAEAQPLLDVRFGQQHTEVLSLSIFQIMLSGKTYL